MPYKSKQVDTYTRIDKWEPGDATAYTVALIAIAPESSDGMVTVVIMSPHGVGSPAGMLHYDGTLSDGTVRDMFNITNPHTITHITALLCFMLNRAPSSSKTAASLHSLHQDRAEQGLRA